MLRRMINILHPIVFGHHSVLTEQISTRLIGSFFLCLLNKLIYDILIPKIRETVDKMITEGSHMIFLGSPDAKSADTSRSYTKYYRGSESGRSAYDRSAYDIRTPKFYTEIEANDVLDQLEDMLDRYGLVRVGDLYDLMGWKFNHTDNNYGWRDLRTARIVRERDQYILKLPRVVCL